MDMRRKIMVLGIGQLVVLAALLFWFNYAETRARVRQEFSNEARSVVLMAEGVRNEMGAKWRLGLITPEMLRTWAQQGQTDRILAAVPVVSSWRAAMATAAEGGYEFRVPKFEPRNAKNAPDPLEARALRKLTDENLQEYVEIDESRNAVRFFRPIRLTEECLLCHGNPSNSATLWGNNLGQDPTGGPMENWRVGEVHGAFEVIHSLDRADAQLARSLWEQAGVALLLLGASVAVFVWLLNRRFSRPLEQLMGGVGRLAQGDLASRVDGVGTDEFGRLGAAFNQMAGEMNRMQDEAHAALQEATVKAAVVENAPINILVADKDLNITYVNPYSLKTFREIADVMPCRPEEVLGKNVDFFHRNPSHQRRLLSDPRNLPHQAHINLGHHILDLRASAIYDARGQYQGPMVAWAVITEQQRLEAEVREQAEAAQRRSTQLLEVASRVTDAANTVAASAEELSANAAQLAQGSDRQKETVEGTASAIQEMAASSRTVANNTDNLARLVTDNSAALNELAASVVSVTQSAERMNQGVVSNSSAIEELAASIQSQAHSAEQANRTAEQASSAAREGALVVRQAIAGMSRIAERVKASAATITELGRSSEQISTIVAVINDIADQTNLLALNAAIEAARAGEQGRGFAVVADEVRKLAERTSKATQEIDDMIGRIQSDTKEVVRSMESGVAEVEEGTELAARSGEALEQIGQGVSQVNELMRHLSEASREQALTSDQIVAATNEMSELVQRVAHAMGEQSQAVDVVSSSFTEMQQLVEEVARAMREQSETSEHLAQAMDEVNMVARASLMSIQETDRATADLAMQADSLRRLAAAFEE